MNASTLHDMQVIFHGVRGSLPMAAATHMRYGGNTSCVEVRCGGRVLILDAGTGLYAQGERMQEREIDLLLSHTHIDHVMGFPFFQPLFRKDAKVRVWAGHLEEGIEAAMRRLMSPPLFPLTIEDVRASVEWKDFAAGEGLADASFARDGIEVRTIALNHPDRATGYRIVYKGVSVCYLTDLEHRPGEVDAALAEFVRGADVLIYDSTYDDAEFVRYQGWGHSTWQQAVRLADAGQVKQVALFHHDTAATDAILDARAEALASMRPGSVVAHEGLVLTPGRD